MAVSIENRIGSPLLRLINERRILELIQHLGSVSRAGLTRASGMTAPTVSKAVDSLLKRGLLEESDPIDQALGRPGRLVRLASESATVLGMVVDLGSSCVVASGLDGNVTEAKTERFETPDTYAALLDNLEAHCRRLMAAATGTIRGACVSVPGLVNERLQEIVFSPNLHLLNSRNPARDLEKRLGIHCVLLHKTSALCLSERMYGGAKGLRDFAMLDVSTGFGLGVMSGGHLLSGHSGMAGELGHLTADPNGIRCGCGNRGCLETLATDSALVRLVAEQLGRPTTLQEVADLIRNRNSQCEAAVNVVSEYLAIGIAAVINLFNPTSLFVRSTLLVDSEDRFAMVLDRVRQRTLTPSLADCKIVPNTSSRRQAAIAGIIHHLINTWAPSVR